MINSRQKYHFLLWIVWPLGGIILAIPAFIISPWFVLLVFVWAILIEILTSRIACPNCGKKVGWGTYNLLGIKFKWWKVFVGKECENCGYIFLQGKTRDTSPIKIVSNKK